MDLPPAVRYPFGRSRVHLGAVVACWMLMAWGALAFLLQQSTSWRGALLLFACAMAGLVAVIGWRNTRVGVLQWDGQLWTLILPAGGPVQRIASTQELGQVRVVLDLQTTLLICAQGPLDRRQWIWLQRSSCPELWMDLRRALVANQRRNGYANTSASMP